MNCDSYQPPYDVAGSYWCISAKRIDATEAFTRPGVLNVILTPSTLAVAVVVADALYVANPFTSVVCDRDSGSNGSGAPVGPINVERFDCVVAPNRVSNRGDSMNFASPPIW